MSDLLTPQPELLRSEAEIAVLRRAWQGADALEWGGYLLRPDADAYGRDDASSAPHDFGIYGLFLEDRLLYIGKSSSLCSRLHQHRQNSLFRDAFWFDSFSFARVPDFALRDVEVTHIHTLKPRMNKLYEPGGWPGATPMQAALLSMWASDE